VFGCNVNDNIVGVSVDSEIVTGESVFGATVIWEIVGATVVGEAVVGATVVGEVVVGATVVGEVVVGATLVGEVVVGATVVGEVVGATVVGEVVVGAAIVGEVVIGATVVGEVVVGATVIGEAVIGAPVIGEVVVGELVIGEGVVGAPVGKSEILFDRTVVGNRVVLFGLCEGILVGGDVILAAAVEIDVSNTLGEIEGMDVDEINLVGSSVIFNNGVVSVKVILLVGFNDTPTKEDEVGASVSTMADWVELCLQLASTQFTPSTQFKFCRV